ncbi:Uncharacterized protein PBTT_02011 [Plasmodiophora brassicae]|uniref:Uncharacterized protein n=1 Tax=Plasmodiophora brassicae TaxID=37360 RepID=A0A3P3Y3F8_PLABS|nr:unnamed protein product [Plasmodiophora brassicae]
MVESQTMQATKPKAQKARIAGGARRPMARHHEKPLHVKDEKEKVEDVEVAAQKTTEEAVQDEEAVPSTAHYPDNNALARQRARSPADNRAHARPFSKALHLSPRNSKLHP